MDGFEHFTDEELGIGRYVCTPAERAELEALSARYITEHALRQEFPMGDAAAHGPFFPRHANPDNHPNRQYVANPQDAAPEN